MRSRLQLPRVAPTTPPRPTSPSRRCLPPASSPTCASSGAGRPSIVHLVENPIVTAVSFEGNAPSTSPSSRPLIQLKPASGATRSRQCARRCRAHSRVSTAAKADLPPQSRPRPTRRARAAWTWSSSSGRARSPRSTASPSSATARYSPSVSCATSSPPASPAGSTSSRAAAFYDPERIERDKELLRRHYLKNGFPDARVSTRRGRQERGGHRLWHHLHGRGGRALHLRRRHHRAAGCAASTPAGCNSAVAVKPGTIFNQETVDKSVEKLTLALGDQGQAPSPG